MGYQSHLKNHPFEKKLFNQRVVVAQVFVSLLTILLVVRMAYLQIIEFERYHTLSEHNRITVTALTPPRGLIVDRNGVILAENRPAFNLMLSPEHTKDIPGTLQALRSIIPLSDEELTTFRKTLKNSSRFTPIPLKMKLSETEVAQFSVHRFDFPGCHIQASMIRYYPFGELFAHSIGYVGRISEQDVFSPEQKERYQGTLFIGRSGIEQQYENELLGEKGFEHVEVDAFGRPIRVIQTHPPKPGKVLKLSLDINLQRVANEALGTRRGAVVLLSPTTGEIYALASTPSFDPNLFVAGIKQATYQALIQSKEKPLYNRALRGQYPPASTIKPFLALLGLESGKIKAKEIINDQGTYKLNNVHRQFRGWKKKGHGHTDMDKGIRESCDVYFYELSNRLGIDLMSPWLLDFGFGKLTGIDIPGELPGLVPSAKWKRAVKNESWYQGETIITGIGQGYLLTTPIQLAAVVSKLANQGHTIVPHLAASLDAERLEYLKIDQSMHFTPSHWSTVIQAMNSVITHPSGTAFRLSRGLTYTMAGKTGTAQVFGMKEDEEYDGTKLDEYLRDHTWFIGFAPLENPQYAVAVLSENSAGSADIARVVMDSAIGAPHA